LEVIKQDPRPELEPAQAILSRLERRRLYVCLGESAFQRADRTASLSEDDIRDEISAIAGQLVDGSYRTDDEGDGGEGAWGHGSPAESDEDEAGLGLGHGRSQGQPFQSIWQPPVPMHSFSNLSQMSSASTQSTSGLPLVPVCQSELIVELMHIHYGLKDKNPVARMRFYQRKAEVCAVGREVKEAAYIASLPAVFEERAVRVFCRSEDKAVKATAMRAFTAWCRQGRCPTPFPSQSQVQAGEGAFE